MRGVLTGAIWIAVRANERGLRPTRACPYCDKQEPEDEEHLLWRCAAWKAKREPLITEIMLLAKALKLGSLRDWPPCIRLCGIIPGSVVQASGIGEGERWRKRCMDLGRVPGTGSSGRWKTWKTDCRRWTAWRRRVRNGQHRTPTRGNCLR